MTAANAHLVELMCVTSSSKYLSFLGWQKGERVQEALQIREPLVDHILCLLCTDNARGLAPWRAILGSAFAAFAGA